jgi:hypothetical protein
MLSIASYMLGKIALTPLQSRRYLDWIAAGCGRGSLTALGNKFGVSRQAIHQSVQTAQKQIMSGAPFICRQRDGPRFAVISQKKNAV